LQSKRQRQDLVLRWTIAVSDERTRYARDFVECAHGIHRNDVWPAGSSSGRVHTRETPNDRPTKPFGRFERQFRQITLANAIAKREPCPSRQTRCATDVTMFRSTHQKRSKR